MATKKTVAAVPAKKTVQPSKPVAKKVEAAKPVAPQAAVKSAIKPAAKPVAKSVAKPVVKAAAPKAAAKAPAKAPAKTEVVKVAAPAKKVIPNIPAPQVVTSSDVVFNVYAPESAAVAVAGEFNGWDIKKGAMKKGKDGVWSLKTKLAPGSYQYKLVFIGADDKQYWEVDNSNPERVADGQGGENSIKHV